MKSSRTRSLLLWCAATDRSFRRAQVGGTPALVGKCIHCGRKLAVGLEGQPLSDATVEHILPRTHGGSDDLENLAIACGRCNAQKGYRHDCQRIDDPKLRRVIETLRARRAKRLRPPLPQLKLPERSK